MVYQIWQFKERVIVKQDLFFGVGKFGLLSGCLIQFLLFKLVQLLGLKFWLQYGVGDNDDNEEKEGEEVEKEEVYVLCL